MRLLQRGHKSSLLALSWGGLRDGLSIALALSIPDLQSHTWIFATTYLVFIFSVVLQGGILDLFLKRFSRFEWRQQTIPRLNDRLLRLARELVPSERIGLTMRSLDRNVA